MSDVVDISVFRGQREQLRDALTQIQPEIPEFSNAARELDRLVGKHIDVLAEPFQLTFDSGAAAQDVARQIASAIDQRYSDSIGALRGHLFMSLIEIEWMRTKRAFMPADLRAHLQSIVLGNLNLRAGGG